MPSFRMGHKISEILWHLDIKSLMSTSTPPHDNNVINIFICLQEENKWSNNLYLCDLTHWGRLANICASKLTIIGSDNGLSPDWRQAIFWTNAGIPSVGHLGNLIGEISEI